MPYSIGLEEVEAVRKVIESGALDRYIEGHSSISSQFERQFAKKMEVHYSLAVSSGTAALICALVGMEIGPGDEVIIPSFTYIATALAVLAVGAVPIIAEIDESLTLDPSDVEQKITLRTKAIIPVHMHGLPCNMSLIMQTAKAHNLLVLEDVAQACGGAFRGKKLGSIGDAGIFSFNHYKVITCGEGGALITNNKKIYERSVIQHHGGFIFEPCANDFQTGGFPGWNFRISEISSAILQVQLSKLEYIISCLSTEKAILFEKLTDSSPKNFFFNPINDIDGDCGRALFLMFETEEKVKAFIEKAKKLNIDAWAATTKGHVYTDWLPILNKNINFNYDSCPKTLSILHRTVGISTKIERSKKELDRLISSLINLGKD